MGGALLISRYAPPMFDVGGKRVGRFCRLLPESGWRPHVLTSPLPQHRPVDESAAPWPSGTRIQRELVPGWWPEKRERPSDPTQARPVPTPRPTSLRKRLERQFALPVGPEALLAARTARMARDIAKASPVDLVFATSSPYAMLLHGLAAARALRVPLVLDLRDPWSLNFLQAHRAGWVRRTEARIERALFGAADAVVFTSRSTRNAYARLYPAFAERLHTITNAYDRPVAAPYPAVSDGPLRLVHFGNCYGPRSLETPLRAIRLLCDRGASPSRFDLLNLGRIGERDLQLAARLGLETVLRFEPARGYDAGLELLRGCDLQLLVGYGAESLFIPAKLFDYMAAGSPVMAVVPPGEVSQLVQGRGLGRSCAPGEIENCARILETALAGRRSLRVAKAEDLEAYSAAATTARLAALFDRVTGLTASRRTPAAIESGRRGDRPSPASSSRAHAS